MDKYNIDLSKRMPRAFFRKDCLTLANDLLGKILVKRVGDEYIAAKIVETEAYIGPEDKGCHAYGNRKTKRTEAMFMEGGHAYVYIIYGMYNCLNIVSGEKDKPEAVLIRAVETLHGEEVVSRFRKIKSRKLQDYTNGPGKLCMAMNIDRSDNKVDIVESNQLFIIEGDEEFEVVESTRINIDYAEEYKDKLWRFYIKDNVFVSKK